jgi:hypothetical protein
MTKSKIMKTTVILLTLAIWHTTAFSQENDLLLAIYDWKGNTIAIELSKFGDEFTLNKSEFNKF